MTFQPPGIPTINFDYFNLAETPVFILCNPNKEQLFSLGAISERTLSAKFNALSEISFKAHEYVDGVYIEYYPYLTQRRLVYVETVGYFIISEVSENNDGIQKYKEIKAQSLESELISKRMVVYMSGDSSLGLPESVTLEELLDDVIEQFIPNWSYDSIPDSISEIQLGFDISDKTIYDFLMNDVEEAYGCVFYFDTSSKTIYIADSQDVLVETSIFISHDNVIKNVSIKEITDELSTCLNVMGGNGLDINDINPMGDNNIYNFDYFKNTNWMSQSLIDAIETWESTYAFYEDQYAETAEELYVLYDEWGVLQTDLTTYQIELDALEVEQAAYIEAGDIVNAALIQAQIVELTTLKSETEVYIWYKEIEIDLTLGTLTTIREAVSFETNFTTSQLSDLHSFIIQSSYVNDNIIISDTMTPSEIFAKMEELKSKAETLLEKMSTPKYSIEIDSINFMYIKEFQDFRDQLCLGAQITVEIKEEEYIYPFLLQMDINFDNPEDFSIVFGNRLRLDDEKFLFVDIMNKAITAGNKAKIYSQEWKDWSNYKTNVLNFIDSDIDTSSNKVVNDSDLQIVISKAGIKSRKKLADGTYDPNQLWIINNSIYKTTDGWNTFTLVLGEATGQESQLNNSLFGNEPITVQGYGISASSIVGNVSMLPENMLSGSMIGVNLTGSKAEINVTTGCMRGTNLNISGSITTGSIVVADKIFINETDNSYMANGITLDQGTNTNEAISLKGSVQVNHSINVTETDTYGHIKKASVAGNGGMALSGFSEAAIGIILKSYGITESTLKTTGAGGQMQFESYKGTSPGALGTDGNLLVIKNATTTRFIFDAEGDLWIDGTSGTFDTEDDIALVRALDIERGNEGLIIDSMDKFLKYNQEDLERLKIASFNEDGSIFINTTRLSFLQNGAIWQLYKKIAELQKTIEDAGILPKPE